MAERRESLNMASVSLDSIGMGYPVLDLKLSPIRSSSPDSGVSSPDVSKSPDSVANILLNIATPRQFECLGSLDCYQDSLNCCDKPNDDSLCLEVPEKDVSEDSNDSVLGPEANDIDSEPLFVDVTGECACENLKKPTIEKPKLSYVALIAQAILASPEKKLILADIYQYIADNFTYYNNDSRVWRNSVRHNLSVNECFIKAGRSVTTKGYYWAIHPNCVSDFARGDYRRRYARRRARGPSTKAVERPEFRPCERAGAPYVQMTSSTPLFPSPTYPVTYGSYLPHSTNYSYPYSYPYAPSSLYSYSPMYEAQTEHYYGTSSLPYSQYMQQGLSVDPLAGYSKLAESFRTPSPVQRTYPVRYQPY
nr:FOXL2 protein [Sipunculus nudus]